MATQSHMSKPPRKASKAAEWGGRQRHKAIEKAIEKAKKEADKQNRNLQSKEPACSQPSTSLQLELIDIQEELPAAAWSPDGAMGQAPDLPSNRELLFGSVRTEAHRTHLGATCKTKGFLG